MSSVALTSVVRAESRSTSRGRFALLGLATVVAAVVANVIVYYLGGALVSYDPTFVILQNAGGAISFTLIPAVIAVLLYAALLRFSRNPVRVFTVIAAVVLALSVIPDLTYIPTVAGSSAAQTTVLILMHFVAAGVIVGMLANYARPQAR
ncbi:MAG TPA: DUF6069 family protein [Nitrolancea sp.]|nr:DUF6069 family protein [Nitrolancea sp.]